MLPVITNYQVKCTKTVMRIEGISLLLILDYLRKNDRFLSANLCSMNLCEIICKNVHSFDFPYKSWKSVDTTAKVNMESTPYKAISLFVLSLVTSNVPLPTVRSYFGYSSLLINITSFTPHYSPNSTLICCVCSTIGLGDLVPSSPHTLLSMFGFIVFGLSLVSMVINLIEIKMLKTYDLGSDNERSPLLATRKVSDKPAVATLGVIQVDLPLHDFFPKDIKEYRKTPHKITFYSGRLRILVTL